MQTETFVSSIDTPVNEDEDTTVGDMLSSGSEYAADRQMNYESMYSDLMIAPDIFTTSLALTHLRKPYKSNIHMTIFFEK